LSYGALSNCIVALPSALQAELDAHFPVCMGDLSGLAHRSKEEGPQRDSKRRLAMKAWMTTAAALALLAGISTANAQTPSGATSTNDKAMEQSQPSQKPSAKATTSRKHASAKKHKARHNATTGAGGRTGTIGGPQNDPSIHQSIQRDSRGTPKGPGSDYK